MKSVCNEPHQDEERKLRDLFLQICKIWSYNLYVSRKLVGKNVPYWIYNFLTNVLFFSFSFFDFHLQLDEVCNIEISPELILNLNSPECAWHIFNLQLPNRFETLHKARQKLLVNRNVCWCENLARLSLRWVPDRHHTLRSDIWISVLWVKWKGFSSMGTQHMFSEQNRW